MGASQEIPFQLHGLYARKSGIHAVLGGQQQGGIATPKASPFVILFTGQGGEAHGYGDRWESADCFHYFGEGQEGDMTMTGGNRAIRDHKQDGKRLLLFQQTGKGRPCRYLGEFELISWYEQPDSPATRGGNRVALVFKLRPLADHSEEMRVRISEPIPQYASREKTDASRLVLVRTAQDLFKKRLLHVETKCRITGVADTRFLRASHIKPWALCESGEERVDGCNGLLLAPHVDHLFDRGWISFEDTGRLLVSAELPVDVIKAFKLNLKTGRPCGTFHERQKAYLRYHREHIFGKRHAAYVGPMKDLYTDIEAPR